MSDHRHHWQIRFVTRNIYVTDPEQYWYVFNCRDWRCKAKCTVDRGKFWLQ